MRAQTPNKESGSAILWILVAVALFAALNFAFNSNSRTSTSFLDDAEAEAYAKQIIQYGNEVKSAVKRLQLRGCSDTEISFENNVVSGYTNPNAPSDRSCHVFDVAGAGLSWREFNALFTGDIQFENVKTAGAELTLQITDIGNALCQEINTSLDTDNAANDYEDDVAAAPTQFVGNYDTVAVTDLSGDEVAEFDGETAYCRNNGAGNNFYMLALITR